MRISCLGIEKPQDRTAAPSLRPKIGTQAHRNSSARSRKRHSSPLCKGRTGPLTFLRPLPDGTKQYPPVCSTVHGSLVCHRSTDRRVKLQLPSRVHVGGPYMWRSCRPRDLSLPVFVVISCVVNRPQPVICRSPMGRCPVGPISPTPRMDDKQYHFSYGLHPLY